MTRPRVWTIPAGEPFAQRLGRELLQRAHPSTDMAATTLLVPTNRAARTHSRTLAQEAHPRALLLPRFMPLGEVGQEERTLSWDDAFGETDSRSGGLRPPLAPCIGNCS